MRWSLDASPRGCVQGRAGGAQGSLLARAPEASPVDGPGASPAPLAKAALSRGARRAHGSLDSSCWVQLSLGLLCDRTRETESSYLSCWSAYQILVLQEFKRKPRYPKKRLNMPFLQMYWAKFQIAGRLSELGFRNWPSIHRHLTTVL